MQRRKSAVLSYDGRIAESLSYVLIRCGFDWPHIWREINVSQIGAHAPDVLMIDFDHLRSDCLESVRQLRFVLPECTITVLSSTFETTWARRCHVAGACGVLPSGGSESRLLVGVQQALLTGSFTDAQFMGQLRLN
jgi:DNA-binding NarL/FixJ family response regulator